jgi:HK97 family phage major capsid protein
MTLLEKLEEAKANLKAMTEDSETKAEDLSEAIKAVEDTQAQIEEADKAEALMKKLETPAEEPADTEEKKMEYTNLGEFVAAKVTEANIDTKQKINFTSPAFKVAAPMVIPSGVKPAITTYDANVYGARRELLISDLFSSEVISNNALTFFVESSTVEGGPAYTTEANEKPMMSFGDPTAVTAALRKIASYMKESEELVHDAPWLASAINDRGLYQHQLAVESYLVSALSGTSGIGTGDHMTPDGILKAKMTVWKNSGFKPDALLINPDDLYNILIRKDTDGQYYGGGFVTAPYGNGEYDEEPRIWGMKVVPSASVTAGTCFVGAFKAGASVVRSNEGLRVELATQNEDDFIKNMITVRIEERLVLAVRRPAAFVKITGSSTSTAA